MEKYSQFRDRGSGISPFLPIPIEERSILLLPFYLFLFVIRVPILIGLSLSYLLFLQWLPIGSLGKKAILWCILGTPGIWWIDLQIDGVRRGSLGTKANKPKLPFPGTVIASSYTSPIDCLYLAAIFDPIFTVSYPNTRSVRRVGLFEAMLHALSYPRDTPPSNARLTTVADLIRDNPDASILVFPECTTTNGRGILPFSTSLLSVGPETKIFPINLRYTPADITTPVPGTWLSFLWNLCSKPTHCIRVRIAEGVYNSAPKSQNTYDTNYFDELDKRETRQRNGATNGDISHNGESSVSKEEKQLLDQIGEALARLGRVKRVNLGVKDKQQFVATWSKNRRIW
ncbi:hypothetical protein NA57DRAFT_81423 [Rhizodiscina lignyota]|uniref:Phospholipid/glycerol acyltransferase domain-containing protein n=1 Tax=Rhizodiscina lignyota TaxID=1504668 RepID=A0A9P4I489_9PEZI|nr:hypothetical protein NA57DRAFT_81423 [Rhizodiscina lignyota]